MTRYFSPDAVLRTVWRIKVSRGHLLEWSSSGDDVAISGSLRSMWIGPAIAVAAGVSLASAAGGADRGCAGAGSVVGFSRGRLVDGQGNHG